MGSTKSDYCRLMRKPYTAGIEPNYVSGRLVPPEVQAAVGLDEFRAHHLRPILRCTEGALCSRSVEHKGHAPVSCYGGFWQGHFAQSSEDHAFL